MSVQYPKIYSLKKEIQPADCILKADLYTIGRHKGCDIIVPIKTVSRLHARIAREGARYLLYDNSSANGTYVNGHWLMEPHLLEDQDLIGLSVAKPMLKFEDPNATAETLPHLRYDRQTMTFSLNKEPVKLTPAQFRLLRHLYQRTGTVCDRESCAEAIWGPDYDPGLAADALDRTISNLRRRLRRVDPEAEIIETRPGLGYLLKPYFLRSLPAGLCPTHQTNGR